MRNKLLPFIFSLFIVNAGSAQTWKWAKVMGGTSTDAVADIALDNTDNLYAVGTFMNSANVGGQTVTMTGTNSFIVKFDSLGNLKWTFALPGYLLYTTIDPNNSNNIIAAGMYSGSITIGTTTLNSAGSFDCFAVKTDSLGNIIWATSWGGNGKDTLADIEYQVDGNINVIGAFKSDVLTLPDNINLNKFHDSTVVNNRQGLNLYSAKLLNSDGKAVWGARKSLSGTNLRILLSLDMRGNIGQTYWNSYGQPYSFYRADSTFLAENLIGSISNFTTPGGGGTFENHIVNGGNSHIDKNSNLFYDYGYYYYDTYGICLGCPNLDEYLVVSNIYTLGSFQGRSGGCTSCTGEPTLSGIGTRGSKTVYRSKSSSTTFIGEAGSSWSFGPPGAGERASLLNSTANRIFSGGYVNTSGSTVFIGTLNPPAFGGRDGFVARVDIPAVTLKADAGIDKVICNSPVGVYIGGYPSASGGSIAPYTYNWQPSIGLNSQSIPYPYAYPPVTTQYVLTVTDGTGAISRDTVNIFVNERPGQLGGIAGAGQLCISLDVLPGGSIYTDATCRPIASILPSGTSPVSGNINSCVQIDASVQTFNSQPYVQRHYDITPASNPGTATAIVTLYFTQAEFNNFNAVRGVYPALPTGPADLLGINNLRVTQYHGTGTAPGNYSGTVELIDPDDANIVWNSAVSRWQVSFAVTGFSGFYVSTKNYILPLSLVSFAASNNGNQNLLLWSTSQEQNTSHFTIQRSFDGINFEDIGTKPAAGNSTSLREYNYSDIISNPAKDVYYYRLQMVSINGGATYSAVVKLKLKNASSFSVSPSPFNDKLTINLTASHRSTVQINLLDQNGRKVLHTIQAVERGSNTITLENLHRLPAGFYLVEIFDGQEKYFDKVIKAN